MHEVIKKSFVLKNSSLLSNCAFQTELTGHAVQVNIIQGCLLVYNLDFPCVSKQ